MNPKFLNLQGKKESVIKLRVRGKNIRRICRITGFTEESIRKWLKEAGYGHRDKWTRWYIEYYI